MRRLAVLLSGALLLAAGAAPAAPRLDPESQIARELAGRVAGEPVSCIQLRGIRSTKIIDDTAILYDAGSTIYLNRPRAGRESLDQWDTLVTRTHGSRLCRIDVVQLYDTAARMQTGLVFLGDFIPYRRESSGR